MTAPATAAPSALRLVLSNRLYVAATIATLFTGLGYSSVSPQLASFLVHELHASLPTAGLYYLTALTAPVAGYLVGRRSDHTHRRLGLFLVCSGIGVVGWSAVALSTQVWMPFVISALLLGFAGAASSQVFAMLGDELRRRPSRSNDGVFAIVRAAQTVGWVIGPVLGSIVAATAGYRVLLFATAACALLQAVPIVLVHPRRAAAEPVSEDPVDEAAHLVDRGGIRVLLPLLAFTGLLVLVYAGDTVKFGFLPIYMRDQLHLAPSVAGAVIGIQPLLELAIMPAAILLARRLGRLRVIVLAAVFGVAANLLFASGAGLWSLFAGQAAMAFVWGATAALGLLVAQGLLPHALATASAVFFSAINVGSAIGGLTGGLGVGVLGLPGVFLVPAVLSLLAVGGLVALRRRHPV